MSIFANQSAIRFSTMPIDIIVPNDIPNGALLVFDKKKGVFTASNVKGTSITNAQNVGTNDSTGIFKENTGTTLLFKSLKGEGEISLREENDNIIISTSNETGKISTEEDFELIIDNDNSSTDSRFKLLTTRASSENPEFINIPFFSPITNTSVVVDNDNGRGAILSQSNIDFNNKGIVEGLFIEIRGTDEQDGQFVIDEVGFNGTTPAIWLTEEFQNIQDLGGLNPEVDLLFSDIRIIEENNKKFLQSSSIDFGPLGEDLKTGMKVGFSGTLDNIWDQVFEIKNVAPQGSGAFNYSEIEIESENDIQTGIIFDIDPLSSDQKLLFSIIEFIDETGFSVDENGSIEAENASFNGNYLQIPSGTTQERPQNPQQGYMRLNTDNDKIEIYVPSLGWKNISFE